MLTTFQEIDRSLFLFLNGIHSPFWDVIMYQATKTIIWLPVFVVFLIMVIKNFKWQSILIIIAIAMMITLSDQVTNFFKDSFGRLRPSHEPGLEVHLVNLYKGGLYGFYSAHASNYFALATFFSILFKRYFRFLSVPLFAWAFFITYTRLYLGVHYPGDLLAGMTIGVCIGYFFGRITYQTCENTRDWFDRNT